MHNSDEIFKVIILEVIGVYTTQNHYRCQDKPKVISDRLLREFNFSKSEQNEG